MILNITNYVKYNYFCDDGGIGNVRLRLLKFSDFSWRHTVCIADEDIMHHILVSAVHLIRAKVLLGQQPEIKHLSDNMSELSLDIINLEYVFFWSGNII